MGFGRLISLEAFSDIISQLFCLESYSTWGFYVIDSLVIPQADSPLLPLPGFVFTILCHFIYSWHLKLFINFCKELNWNFDEDYVKLCELLWV